MQPLDISVAPIFAPLCAPSRYKGIYGGRGKGGSHFFADQVISHSMTEKMDIVCLREVQLSLSQSVKKLIEAKIEAHGLGKHFRVLDTHIESIFGGRIAFQGMSTATNESIKSLEGYRIAYIEEAASFSQRSWDLLTPTIRWEDRARGLQSEIWAVWNPNKPSDPIDHFFRGNNRENLEIPFVPRTDCVVVEASWRDNPWFPNVLKSDMEQDQLRDPDKYRHVWEGAYWSRSDARVFKDVVVEEFTRPPGTLFRFGLDFGYARDPSVLVRCSLEGKRLYVDYEAYEVGCEIINLPDLLRTVPESSEWYIYADSSRPETIAHLKKHGFPRIQPSEKGAGSVKEGITYLQGLTIVIHPRCKRLHKDFMTYAYKTDPKTDEVLPILMHEGSDGVDAVRYSVFQLMKMSQTMKRTTVTETIGSTAVVGGWMA